MESKIKTITICLSLQKPKKVSPVVLVLEDSTGSLLWRRKSYYPVNHLMTVVPKMDSRVRNLEENLTLEGQREASVIAVVLETEATEAEEAASQIEGEAVASAVNQEEAAHSQVDVAEEVLQRKMHPEAEYNNDIKE